MPELTSLLTFAAIALGMVLTPGPNMVYLICGPSVRVEPPA